MKLTHGMTKAIRERVGLSQQDVADALDVTVLTVKNWENPNGYTISDAYQTLLANALADHQLAVKAAKDAVMAQEAQHGEAPRLVRLYYYRNQADYDKYGRDAGKVGVVNARIREAYTLLQYEGYDVYLVYKSESDVDEYAVVDSGVIDY